MIIFFRLALYKMNAKINWQKYNFFVEKYRSFTFQVETESGSKRPRIVSEDHESIVAWPGEEYIGTVYPNPATGHETARLVFEKLQDTHSLDSLEFIGGDKTSVNTGPWNGAFR